MISESDTEKVTGPLAGHSTIPLTIGDYRIIKPIGRGGTAVVYEAQQALPERRVALKVLSTSFRDMHRTFRLFRREIDVLARLRHPHIAAIYDAGVSESSECYFAMELVKGKRLTEFCHENDLNARERVTLFLKVCEAVAYAHQKGVVHRDLKPGNILVDEQGTPKVLDFGLARMLETDQYAVTVQSEMKTIEGTIPYMSPEQVSGSSDDIDVRSDVYTLGVILYELLFERMPYQVIHTHIATAVHMICQVKPKTARQCGIAMDRDLELILFKALRKHPENRYQAVPTLADELHRYLNGQPIHAHGPHLGYLLSKAIRRHRKPILAGLVLLVCLLSFAALAWRSSARARLAQHDADTLLSLMDSLWDANLDFSRDTPAPTLGDLLNAMSSRVARTGNLSNEKTAALHHALGSAYVILVGDNPRAELHLKEAIRLRSHLHGRQHPLTRESLLSMAWLHMNQSHHDLAESLLTELMAPLNEENPADRPEFIKLGLTLAFCFGSVGKLESQEAMLNRVLARAETPLEETDAALRIARTELAGCYALQGRFSEAAELYDSVAKAMQVSPTFHENLQSCTLMAAQCYVESGDLDRARTCLETLLHALIQVSGQESGYRLSGQLLLAEVLLKQHKPREALNILVQATHRIEQDFKTTHLQRFVQALTLESRSQAQIQSPHSAAENLNGQIQALNQLFGDVSHELLPLQLQRTAILRTQGKPEQADAALRTLAHQARNHAESLILIAEWCAETRTSLDEGMDWARSGEQLAANPTTRARALLTQARILAARGDDAEARALAQTALRDARIRESVTDIHVLPHLKALARSEPNAPVAAPPSAPTEVKAP